MSSDCGSATAAAHDWAASLASHTSLFVNPREHSVEKDDEFANDARRATRSKIALKDANLASAPRTHDDSRRRSREVNARGALRSLIL